MQSRTHATDINSLKQSLDELIEKIEKKLIVKQTAESKDYVTNLKTLKSTILVDYTKAQNLGDQDRVQKICNFANSFHLATDEMINPNSDLADCMSAIEDAANAAQLCETAKEQLAKQAESISPAFYVLGGLIGLLFGIPLGVVAGIVIGAYLVLWFMYENPTLRPPDLFSLKVWLGCCAVAGAIYCASKGAAFLADKLHRGYISSCRAFRPEASISELGSSLLHNTIFNNRARLQSKVLNKHLPPDLVDITQTFL